MERMRRDKSRNHPRTHESPAALAVRHGVRSMPGKKHLKGVSDEEQRQYEHIKEEAKKSGRYKGREDEVAARTVLKMHKKKGHKKGE